MFTKESGLSASFLAITAVISLVFGFAVLITFSLLFSAIYSATSLPEQSVKIASVAAIVVATFICGFVASKRIGESGIFVGSVSAFAFFVVAVFFSLLFKTFSADSAKVVINAVCFIVPGLIGGIFGVNSSSKKRR